MLFLARCQSNLQCVTLHYTTWRTVGGIITFCLTPRQDVHGAYTDDTAVKSAPCRMVDADTCLRTPEASGSASLNQGTTAMAGATYIQTSSYCKLLESEKWETTWRVNLHMKFWVLSKMICQSHTAELGDCYMLGFFFFPFFLVYHSR
jgi:hypothetical protein